MTKEEFIKELCNSIVKYEYNLYELEELLYEYLNTKECWVITTDEGL